ncbi:hypothetical protein CJ430_31515, partial [Klebsiella pneumoniae]
KGMLDRAVCGDLFASPSVDAVLTAIQAVTGEAGTSALLVKACSTARSAAICSPRRASTRCSPPFRQ